MGFGLITRKEFVGSFVKVAAAGALTAVGASALAGCSGQASQKQEAGNGKVKVAASFYSMADFAQKIGGDNVEVTCLVPSGTEPHDWEPSTSDIKTIETAAVLVYNGAGMEHWVSDTLASVSNKNLVAVEASSGVDLRRLSSEELQEARAEDPDASDTDPHVWLDPKNVKIEMENIRAALAKVDPDNAAVYQQNYDKWASECDKLDKEFTEGLSSVSQKSIVVSHEAYGYLCQAYGLDQVAIEGIEPDAEPDAQTMAEIVQFVKDNNVKVIFSEELVSPKVAQSIAAACGAEVMELNPIEGLSEEDLKAGEDYFSVMRDNLNKLESVLA